MINTENCEKAESAGTYEKVIDSEVKEPDMGIRRSVDVNNNDVKLLDENQVNGINSLRYSYDNSLIVDSPH